ncbi:hypothetical protein NDN08_003193 [Rhodosorus marinus]|uniref:RING-type domain-containing protein n=1 Tax=Rhodosorus marinus TaxID=101924 RepID=A0AAV8UVZ9_9RHOD|nr:hypothetical protein NDN08_003193 [Rhodosorus marinus]
MWSAARWKLVLVGCTGVGLIVTSIFIAYHYSMLELTRPFTSVSCTPTGWNITRDSSGERLYRCNFNVTGIDADEDSPRLAYRYGSPVYNQTESMAEQCGGFMNNSTCYVDPDARDDYLSMSPAYMEDKVTSLMILADVFAVLAGFVLVAFVVVSVCQGRREGNNRPVETGEDEENPPEVYTHRKDKFSKEEVQSILKLYRASVSSLKDDFACAICLDNADRKQQYVRLDCKHEYHSRCLRLWLRRGGMRCPLCNREVEMHKEDLECLDNCQLEVQTAEGESGPFAELTS